MLNYSVITCIFIVLEWQITRSAPSRYQPLVLQYYKEAGVVVNLYYFTFLSYVENAG